MMFDKTVSYIKGRAYFIAENGFFGIFISDCRKNNVPLYNVKVENGILYAETDFCALHRLDKTAYESGVNITVKKTSGFPVIFLKLRRRYGIPAGLAVFLILFLYFSSVLWTVEIHGASKTDIYLVRCTLEECGIKRGSPIRRINKNEAEDRLDTLTANIQRATVNIVGNRAYVEIYEREISGEKEKDYLYSDIVAAKDGEIIKADVFQGQSLLENKTEVKKGDLLVTGEVTMKNGQTRYTESLARITARTHSKLTVSSAKKLFADTVEEKNNYYSLGIFGLTVPITQGPSEENKEYNEYLLNTEDSVFPVGIIRNTTILTRKKDIFLSDTAAFLMCANDLAENIHDNFKNGNITEIRENIHNGTTFTIETEIICEEDICENKYNGNVPN